ncbi:MAG: serine/threonine protein kinase [Phycisphaerales bacterium]|nr:MAG: serine/threonine protein kinase [Phycisphaerales bacterium]
MDDDPHEEERDSTDEDQFEESLVTEVDADLAAAETQLVEPQAIPAPPTPVVKQPAWVGKVLGHFKLLRLIGEGKMGRVIQAQDINLHRIVALKVLAKRLPGTDAQRRVDQFLREARAAAQIEHPNVVRVYEINQHDGWWYIAMEMLDAGNLRQVVKAAGPLSVPRACALIADAATGLAAAHELGIIHRDVKPANLMLTRAGRCKLTDFGLVRLDDPNDPFDFTQKAVGSPAFMAPEIILRREQTSAIDIYSLGGTLFHALTGRALYTGQNVQDVLKKHVRAPLPDIRKLLPDSPPSLAALIARTIAKDPAKRPSAADMAAALRAEAIATQADDSGTLSPGRSGIVSGLTDSRIGTLTDAQLAATTGLWRKVRSIAVTKRFLIAAPIAALAIAVGAALIIPRSRLWPRRSPQPAHLARYFPGARETYGTLPPSTSFPPLSPASDAPPAFSWVGKIDPRGFRLVASRRGGHFYTVNAPEAILIRAEDFVGYKSVEDARADGKVPVQ